MRLEIPGAFHSKTDVHRDQTEVCLKKAEKEKKEGECKVHHTYVSTADSLQWINVMTSVLLLMVLF